jgi:hypothetical protein
LGRPKVADEALMGAVAVLPVTTELWCRSTWLRRIRVPLDNRHSLSSPEPTTTRSPATERSLSPYRTGPVPPNASTKRPAVPSSPTSRCLFRLDPSHGSLLSLDSPNHPAASLQPRPSSTSSAAPYRPFPTPFSRNPSSQPFQSASRVS